MTPDSIVPAAGGAAPVPELETYRRRLIDGCRSTEGVTSLVFFGSASSTQAGRRDEWSDLDFNVFFTNDAAPGLRESWPFLPDPERIVLRAREGGDGGVVLYDDGMLFEFGAGSPWQIVDPARDVALDGGDLRYAEPPPPPDPADEIRLFLVKLFIGVGRHRRGERVAGGAHVRTYAVKHLAWALRLRLGAAPSSNPFDPLRRLEEALPGVGARLGDLVDADLESCARGLVELARAELEPGWADFPSAAADVVQRRLGWVDGASERP